MGTQDQGAEAQRKPRRSDRRSFVTKTAAATGAIWTAPIVLGMLEPVAAATPSNGCPFTFCFDDGTTEGWVIDNGAGAGNGLWNVNNSRSVSPTSSLHYGTGFGGNYDTGTRNAGTVTSPSFVVPASGGALSFDIWREVEVFGSGTWDEFSVSILPSGTVEYAVSRDGGTGGLFEPISIDLAAYAGTSIQVVFAFDTGDAQFNNFEGIYVDNVMIPCSTPPAPPTTGFSTTNSTNWPDDDPGFVVESPQLSQAIGVVGPDLQAFTAAGSSQGKAKSNSFFPERPDPTSSELRRRTNATR